MPSVHAQRHIICAVGAVQEILVLVQQVQVDLHHRLCRLHGGDDVLHIPPLHNKGLVGQSAEQGEVGVQLIGLDLFFQCLTAGHNRFFRYTQRDQTILCCLHRVRGILQLAVQQVDYQAHGLRLRLVPFLSGKAQVIRPGGVCQFPGTLGGDDLCLSDIGVVRRFQIAEGVVFFRRDIARLLLCPFHCAGGAAPDLCQLIILKGRITFFRFPQEHLMRFVGIAEPLHDLSGTPAQGGVPAAFRDDLFTVMALIHISVELFLFQKLIQHPGSGIVLHQRIFRSVKEVRRVQRFRIDKRQCCRQPFLQRRVGCFIGDLVNGKHRVELRSRDPAVLHLHVVPAVVHRHGYIRQRFVDLFRPYPVLRVVGVIVVKLNRDTVAADEIIVAAVAVLIFRAHVIAPHGFPQ